MRSKWLTRGAFVALVSGVLGSSVGCAEERDPINRVQAGVVPKAFFLGASFEDYKDDPEFRTKAFNIDSAMNVEGHEAAVGLASAVDRVRWEVTEKLLIARRSYQETPNVDKRGLPRKEVSPGKYEFPGPANGTIIAAYEIKKHFDIRRGYNAATGEEQNTIEENENDRPWQKREYMRVDWSKNTAVSTSGNTSWVFGGEVVANAVNFSESNEADNVDRPHFEVAEGYFDITNKYTVTPEINPSWGLPDCVIQGWLNGTTTFDCSAAEVKVRHSFVRLTGAEDFEPFEESFAPRDIVGNWGNAGSTFNREYGGPPISAWDPQYGFTDKNTKTFYSIHNLWEKSHVDIACTSNDDVEVVDGTADQCSAVADQFGMHAGSQCDIHIGKCTIPVRDRSVKTIGYWLNPEAPVELADEVSADGKTVVKQGAYEELTDTWNQFLKVAIATRREVECRRTKGADSRESCHAEFFEGTGPESKQMVKFGGWGIDTPKKLDIDKGAEAFTTCHNPVRSYDAKFCGKPGEVIRLGDVRKNYAIYWPYASRAPFGGVATIGGDPLTGEMVGATATTMLRSASIGAAQQRDIIQLAIGDVTMEQLVQGVQASRYTDALKKGALMGDEMSKPMTAADIAKIVANVDVPAIQAAAGESPATLNAMAREQRQMQTARMQALRSPQTATIAAADAQLLALSSKIESTEYRAAYGNKTLLRLAAESADKSTAVYNAISALATKDPARIQQILEQHEASMGSKGICFTDAANASVSGTIYLATLAPYFKALYSDLTPEERGMRIYNDLLRESTKGIAFHELGHSIGLRHNFSSSWDSLNYTPQYWQLRTNQGDPEAMKACPYEGRAPGKDCMGPRYLDPVTPEEAGRGSEPRPGIDYFANTSTMEYHIERGGETIGAGTYDLHAMKTLYGRSLETFDPKLFTYAEQKAFALKMLSQGIAKDLIFDPSVGFGVHYTKAAVKAKIFDMARDCRDATKDEKAIAKWRIVNGKVCSQPPRNHLAYDDMKTGPLPDYKIGKQVIEVGSDGVRWQGVDENGQPLVRWHYRYGEDYSSGGYLHAKMFDAGADVYEITNNVINRYENQYPWAYFRRQNKEFAWWSLPYSVASATFSRLRGYHWSTTTDISRGSSADKDSDDGDKPAVLASAKMFDFLQRVILTPEPTDSEYPAYGEGDFTSQRTPTRPGAAKIFDLQSKYELQVTKPPPSIGTLGIVDGRFIQVDFDNGRGGSWDYFHYPIHSGFDDEKVLALRQLVDARPTLSTVSRENALDGRDPYISFRTDTPHALDRLIGGLLSEDWETIAPSMSADGQSHQVFSLLARDPAQLQRPADSKGILFPNIGYSNELGTAISALLFSRYSTDMVMAQKMRVRYEGDNAPVIPEDRKVAFTDPVTGHRYIAARFGTELIGGRAVEKGIASRMIQHANDLLADAYNVKAAPPNSYGEHEPIVENGVPSVRNVVAEQNLRRYIGLLDAMRQIGNILGGGPLGGGAGDDE